MTDSPHKLTFPRTHRLSGSAQFSHVYNAKMRKNAGPLTLMTAPNNLPHNRLGLSVSRKLGNAITRNRIKRLLRECYRLTQHNQPQSYDIIIIPRSHSPLLTLTEYQSLFLTTLNESHENWNRRRAKQLKSDIDKTTN
ncbi:ribonuclease P protein component [Poriferisphaera sp. WC338]|uniref:ribonuclease P protein component n=1 Tax=Poriferisphaera sp. WC338 TaxID=3425129 RepID=UPI003D8174DA